MAKRQSFRPPVYHLRTGARRGPAEQPEELTPHGTPFRSPYGALTRPLVLAGDRLIGVASSTLFAVDIYTLTEIKTLDESGTRGFPHHIMGDRGAMLAVGAGTVFVLEGGVVKAFLLTDGTPIVGWKAPVIEQVSSLQVVDATLIAVHRAGVATVVSGFDAATGARVFGPIQAATRSPGKVAFGHGAVFFVADGALTAI